MAPRSEFGRTLRRFRESVPGLSALQLAKRAGLSGPYVSQLEREERIPRWDTCEKLADALELNAAERAELFQAADLTRKPKLARELTTTETAGLQVWNNVARALLGVERVAATGEAPGAIDDCIFEAVPAVAWVLAWDSVRAHAPSATMKVRLRRVFDGVSRSVEDPWLCILAVASAFRSLVLATPQTVHRLTSDLRSWEVREEFGGVYPAPAQLSLTYDASTESARLSFDALPVDLIARYHMGVLAHRLWEELFGARGDRSGALATFPALPEGAYDALKRVPAILKDAARLESGLPLDASILAALRRHRVLSFLRRLSDAPPSAARILIGGRATPADIDRAASILATAIRRNRPLPPGPSPVPPEQTV